MAWKIDEIDRKMLELLRENADMPNEKLGRRVGLSEPAARRRVANLVSRGVIKRFTIDVEEGGAVMAIVFLSTSPHASSEKAAHALAEEPGVSAVWEISGDYDFAFLLFASDMASLNRRLDEIRALSYVKKTKTSVVMKKWR